MVQKTFFKISTVSLVFAQSNDGANASVRLVVSIYPNSRECLKMIWDFMPIKYKPNHCLLISMKKKEFDLLIRYKQTSEKKTRRKFCF